MRIRKATEKDLRAIKKIYQEIYAERPYKEKWKPLLLKKKLKDMLTWMKTFVAVDKKKLAGFVFFYTYDWPDGKRAYIEDFGVAKEQRNTGIGLLLLHKTEEYLKKNRIKKIILNVNIKAPIFEYYKKKGYKKTNYIQMEKKLR